MENNQNPTDSTAHALIVAIKYLSYQPRTIYEIKKYLNNKNFNRDIIRQVIATLIDKNYLNDKNYAQSFIETMVKNRPKSKFAIGFALKKKGVDLSIFEPFLEQYDDYSLAIKAVTPKIKIWKKLDMKQFKRKLMNFLQYRGFNYETSMAALNHFKENYRSHGHDHDHDHVH